MNLVSVSVVHLKATIKLRLFDGIGQIDAPDCSLQSVVKEGIRVVSEQEQ